MDLQAAGIETEVGRHSIRTLESDLLIRRPGVPRSNPVLQEARRRGILMVSELEVAFWFCQAPIIAVTGSNGKTTTVEWLGDVFRHAGKPVVVCGNVGYPFSAAVDSLSDDGVAVVEVSSFQLEDVLLFSPRIAVITNLSPDHLDRYDDYDAYIQAKCRIFERMKLNAALVFNRGDAELARRVRKAKSRLLSFGQDPPPAAGAGIVDDDIVLSDGKRFKKLIAKHELSLPGPHNAENALAVACAAADLGTELAAVAKSLSSFAGVAHRLERLQEINGVLWINDSKATNIASGLVALNSFERPIILLAGGRDKGSDFGGVAEEVARKTRFVILFGEAGSLIERAWMGKVALQRVVSLEAAVQMAVGTIKPGDVVLLSPMCASFDEFKNYEDRGQQFKNWVEKYAASKST